MTLKKNSIFFNKGNRKKYIESDTEDEEDMEVRKKMNDESPDEQEPEPNDIDYEEEDDGQIEEEDGEEGDEKVGVVNYEDDYESESDVNEDCCFICRGKKKGKY